MADRASFNQDFLKFLARSGSPFHAVEAMVEKLVAKGFSELSDRDAWQTKPGGKYFVKKNDSSLVAFQLGTRPLAETGFRMVAAHSDSPCLKLKPNPELLHAGAHRLGVEVYGSAILSTWFDRELALAGRVVGKNQSGKITSELVDWDQAVAIVPNLAIHLNRTVNKERSINEQIELPAIWTQSDLGKNFRKTLLEVLQKQGSKLTDIVDFDLCFYDLNPPALVGPKQEFITSARIDNLASCYIGLSSLLESTSEGARLFVAFDHEEVGSRSVSGAQSSFLANLVLRLCGGIEERMQAISRSVLVSADNAHGLHPNYAEKMDPLHAPRLNAGPVIKSNSNQSYATNAKTAAVFAQYAEHAKVPTQKFVVRTDMGCGSTVGPIVAAQLGIDTVDVGIPQWGMHSCRETMGSEDAFSLYRILQGFYASAEQD